MAYILKMSAWDDAAPPSAAQISCKAGEIHPGEAASSRATGSSVGKLQSKKGCTRAVPMKMTRRPWLRTDVSTAARAELQTTCYAIGVSPFVLTVNRLLVVLLIFIANVAGRRVHGNCWGSYLVSVSIIPNNCYCNYYPRWEKVVLR